MHPSTFFRRRPAAAAAAVFAAAAALVAGCESSDSYSITVSPGSATLRPGQSVTLVASGWSDYAWSLDTDGVGHLSRHTGDSVVFTAASGSSGSKVKVTATALGSGSSTNSAGSASSGGFTASSDIEIE